MNLNTDSTFVNDSIKPDLKVYWKDEKLNKEGNCTIFTYGRGIKLAIAAFFILYPNHQILMIEEI